MYARILAKDMTPLVAGDDASASAVAALNGLLDYDPKLRLGSAGVAEIKARRRRCDCVCVVAVADAVDDDSDDVMMTRM